MTSLSLEATWGLLKPEAPLLRNMAPGVRILTTEATMAPVNLGGDQQLSPTGRNKYQRGDEAKGQGNRKVKEEEQKRQRVGIFFRRAFR